MPQPTLDERFQGSYPSRAADEYHAWLNAEEQRFILWGLKEKWPIGPTVDDYNAAPDIGPHVSEIAALESLTDAIMAELRASDPRRPFVNPPLPPTDREYVLLYIDVLPRN